MISLVWSSNFLWHKSTTVVNASTGDPGGTICLASPIQSIFLFSFSSPEQNSLNDLFPDISSDAVNQTEKQKNDHFLMTRPIQQRKCRQVIKLPGGRTKECGYHRKRGHDGYCFRHWVANNSFMFHYQQPVSTHFTRHFNEQMNSFEQDDDFLRHTGESLGLSTEEVQDIIDSPISQEVKDMNRSFPLHEINQTIIDHRNRQLTQKDKDLLDIMVRILDAMGLRTFALRRYIVSNERIGVWISDLLYKKFPSLTGETPSLGGVHTITDERREDVIISMNIVASIVSDNVAILKEWFSFIYDYMKKFYEDLLVDEKRLIGPQKEAPIGKVGDNIPPVVSDSDNESTVIMGGVHP